MIKNSVFIGGSISINKLDIAVLHKLQNIMLRNYTVLVGDAYGADKCVQDYYKSVNYKNVIVYHIGNTCRYNVGNWKTKRIPISNFSYLKNKYQAKDICMTKDCQYSFQIWDGKSNGTRDNIIRCFHENKYTIIYLFKEKQFFIIKNLMDFENFKTKFLQKGDSL